MHSKAFNFSTHAGVYKGNIQRLQSVLSQPAVRRALFILSDFKNTDSFTLLLLCAGQGFTFGIYLYHHEPQHWPERLLSFISMTEHHGLFSITS